jgi:hypothetical protein
MLHDKVRAESIHMRCFNSPSFAALTPEIVAKADSLFDEAEKRVAGDPTLLKRVRIARLPLMYTQLTRGRAWARAAGRAGVMPALDEKALADKFFAVAAEANVTMIREGGKFETFKQALLERVNLRRSIPTPPPGAEKLPPEKVLDAQDDEFRLHREGEITRLKPVEGASDGMAAWMTGATKEWAIQWPLDVKACKPGKRYDAYVVVKIVKKGKEGGAFQAGIYDVEKRKSLGAISPRAADVQDGWQCYKIGAFLPEGQQYLWAAGCENGANIADIFVDRFFLVEAESKDKSGESGTQELKN